MGGATSPPTEIEALSSAIAARSGASSWSPTSISDIGKTVSIWAAAFELRLTSGGLDSRGAFLGPQCRFFALAFFSHCSTSRESSFDI
jgi:hypothetical protein